MLFIHLSFFHVHISTHLLYPKYYPTLISVIFLISYYALPGILGTLMSQTVTLCPRLFFVAIHGCLVFGNNECFPLALPQATTLGFET